MLKYLPKDVLAQWALGSVAVAGAASVAYVVVFPSDPPEPDLPRPETVLTEPAVQTRPRDEAAPDMQVAMAPAMTAQAPRFDLVRVTDLGDVLVAGQAPATSSVAVLVDEAQVAQTVSTPEGEFVLMFDLDPAPIPRVLELEVRLPNGDRIRSVDTLMLAPRSDLMTAATPNGGAPAPRATMREVEVAPLFPPAAPPAPPQALPQEPAVETTLDLSSDLTSDLAPDLAPDLAAPAPGDLPATGDQSVGQAPLAVLMRSDGSVEMLGEAPRLPQRGGAGQVSIESVTYGAGGDVALSGRAARGSSDIQIYIDNQPILRARAEPDGNWQAQLDGIERGVYRLRVDELDEAAQVTSRAEIPFERVTPEIAREAAGPQALIVQPGNTLWGMSRDRFGDGARYMRIFDANRDQIRNPDLIYPGQVFILPDDPG